MIDFSLIDLMLVGSGDARGRVESLSTLERRVLSSSPRTRWS